MHKYFWYSVIMAPSEICLYTWKFFKNNLLAPHFRTKAFCKDFPALKFTSTGMHYVGIWKNSLLSLYRDFVRPINIPNTEKKNEIRGAPFSELSGRMFCWGLDVNEKGATNMRNCFTIKIPLKRLILNYRSY